MPKEPAWSDSEIAHLRENYGKVSVREIAEALQRPPKAVRTKAHRLGVQARDTPRPWTDSDTEYLVANYEHMPTLEIARTLGRQHATIKTQADKIGLLSIKRRRAAAVRHDYFATMRTPIQAYVLGLLASDGCVSRNEIIIDLHPKDVALVELVRDELAPLSRVVPRPAGNRVGFRVTSAQMGADLYNLGVTPRRPSHSGGQRRYRRNWRAVSSSDALTAMAVSVTTPAVSYYKWSLVSASRPFLEEVQARITRHAGVKIRGPYRLGVTNNALSIQYVGPKTHMIDAWLHADVPGLARKRLAERERIVVLQSECDHRERPRMPLRALLRPSGHVLPAGRSRLISDSGIVSPPHDGQFLVQEWKMVLHGHYGHQRPSGPCLTKNFSGPASTSPAEA